MIQRKEITWKSFLKNHFLKYFVCCCTVLLLERGLKNCFGVCLHCVVSMLKTINQLLSIKKNFFNQTIDGEMNWASPFHDILWAYYFLTLEKLNFS